ncbi:hypothetical protein ABZ957_28950 [Streptomyces sp. NPDC046316]|uniref:hypothetical protein n=1 Tax=Streptomyces sp. NPDC046316 TaxID=3154494 RepID=UPI0033EC6E4B
MAAAKLTQAARALGVEMKVETQGFIGARERTTLTTMSEMRTARSRRRGRRRSSPRTCSVARWPVRWPAWPG